MSRRLLRVVAAGLGLAGLAWLAPAGPSSPGPSSPGPSTPGPPGAARDRAAPPLRGRVVVLDPGHQLGNRSFPRETARQVPAGGFHKPCNTTGTATDAGFPEATFTWLVATRVAARLERAGARVVLTRHRSSDRAWGPCVDARGRAGAAAGADLVLSIHGDGRVGGGPGFHVIAPPDRPPWTGDVWRPSRRLARTVRAALEARGLPPAGYAGGGDGLDVRSDLATLNLSDVPVVLVELGNMRDPVDARRMTRPAGRATYAAALATAVRRYLR